MHFLKCLLCFWETLYSIEVPQQCSTENRMSNLSPKFDQITKLQLLREHEDTILIVTKQILNSYVY